MPIDINALRKFQEVFLPILELIPAILTAEAGKRDLDREIVLKKMELDKTTKNITEVIEEADKHLSLVNSEVEMAREMATQQKAKALADIETAKNADADNRANTEREQAQLFDELSQKVAKLQSQYLVIDSEYENKLAAAEADFAAKVAPLEIEVKELEKRKAAAEKALDALRSKLG